jgi:hypothetical protein
MWVNYNLQGNVMTQGRYFFRFRYSIPRHPATQRALLTAAYVLFVPCIRRFESHLSRRHFRCCVAATSVEHARHRFEAQLKRRRHFGVDVNLCEPEILRSLPTEQ